MLMQAGRLAMEWTADVLAVLGLSLHEYAALLLIQRFGGTSQRAIAEWLGLSTATVSGIAVQLEGQGLILRDQDLFNPGRRALYVTRKGVQLLAEAADDMALIDAHFREHVDGGSIQALSELPPRSLSPIELAIRAAGYCQ